MTDRIEHLTAADYEECVTFLQYSFGDTLRFDEVLPAVYQPTDQWMHCNLAIRREGRIAAVVGAFPITWQVGERTLKMVGIGGVSVDPKYRRQGLMNKLMDRAVEWIGEEDYQLSYLGGQRQRYRYWGWERCGTELSMELSPRNIRHESDEPLPRITLEPAGDEMDDWEAMHNRQPIHCVRADFVNNIRWRRAETLVARSKQGEAVGYLVMHENENAVHELVCDDPLVGVAMMRKLVETHDKAFTVDVATASPSPLTEALGQIVETTTVDHAHNWQVFDWSNVLDALVDHQAKHRNLPSGEVVIAIEGQPHALRLSVDGDTGQCVSTDDPPALTLDACTMLRVLFGPTSPALVTAVPPEAALLEAWCPLPMGIPRLDWV